MCLWYVFSQVFVCLCLIRGRYIFKILVSTFLKNFPTIPALARFREDSEKWWWLQQLPTSLGSSERKEVNWHPTICCHLDIFLWNLMSIRFQTILPRSWEEGGSVKKSLDSSASCPRAKEEMASKSGIRQMWEFVWRQKQRQIRAGIWFAGLSSGCCTGAQEKESCCDDY